MSPVNTTNANIVVNLKSGSKLGKTRVSGTLNIKGLIQNTCEDILQRYERKEQHQAREEAKKLLEKYQDSLVVKKLEVLILYRDRKYLEAYKKIKALLKSAPKDARMINMQGMIQRQLGLFKEAVSSYKLAISIQPSLSDPYNNLAIIYRYFGKKDLAIKNFRNAISKNKNFSSAFYNLSCIKGYKFTKNEINTIEALLKKLDNVNDVARCHFSLYNAYSKEEQDVKAFKHLNLGNNILAKTFKRKRPLGSYLESLEKNIDADFFKKRDGLEAFYKSPFFIVGMPRSGSSLLEQILSSHPKVYGLGETKSIPEILASINHHIDSNISIFIEAFSKLDINDLGNRVTAYKSMIEKEINGYEIYTDKMLKNFKTIGFIKILLPNAKFIHIKRNALDTCLSCYEKKFSQGHEYSYDLITLGAYYSAYVDIMEFWKQLFPEDIHEIKYEDLVLDNENIVRQCLAFMDLEMDKKCLEHHKNTRQVFTASTDQVREKINSDSIGKWKIYEKQLQPLIQELKSKNVALD